MTTCRSCGRAIALNAATCPFCGARRTTLVTWIVFGCITLPVAFVLFAIVAVSCFTK